MSILRVEGRQRCFPREPRSPRRERPLAGHIPVPARRGAAFRAQRAPQPPPGVLSRGPVPFHFTFLGGYREPPGMLRNNWPLVAAGAQEIRALKLEGNRGSRLAKKHGFRGWARGPSAGVPPLFPQAGDEFPASCRHPGFTGHRGFTQEGAGGAGEEGGRERRPSRGRLRPRGRRLTSPCFPRARRQHLGSRFLAWVCS